MFKIGKQSKCLSIDEWMRKIQWCPQSYLSKCLSIDEWMRKIVYTVVPQYPLRTGSRTCLEYPAPQMLKYHGPTSVESTDLEECSAKAYTEKTHI